MTFASQPWLVQRLLPPFENAAALKGKPTPDMVFGGARDLSQEQHDAISEVFRLDSMGSAHFEFQALPTAFHTFANNAELRAYETIIKATPGPLAKQYKVKTKEAPVFIIAAPADLEDVHNFITSEACGDNNDLKRESEFQFCFFADELTQKAGRAFNAKKISGWFDIQNGYMFFTDRSMFDRVRTTFEIQGDVTSWQKPVSTAPKAQPL